MSTVIKIEDLSKRYRLGLVGTNTLAGDVKAWWARLHGREHELLRIGDENRLDAIDGEYVWALRNINLEVQQGEVLGIIGKNGAGKSTLLKILSRVTGPTTGSIKVRGRIASLLEVGTGFHGELTGRENIYLNGAVLGMRRHEIKQKFDEIVDFAGVAKYIDTPVKRYSSGMYVRLAFAVAAHLEPEILIVDEVLAVGDAEFQKKAIGKMQEVSAGQGRTVLFVSHNMQSVSTLTTKCAFMAQGTIADIGDTETIIRRYISSTKNSGHYIAEFEPIDKPYIKSAKVLTSVSGFVQEVQKHMDIEIVVSFPVLVKSPAVSYQMVNSRGVPVVHHLLLSEEISFGAKTGDYLLRSSIPSLLLYPDIYTLTIYFADKFLKQRIERVEEVCKFEVTVIGEVRDYYWAPGNAIYLENNAWSVIPQ